MDIKIILNANKKEKPADDNLIFGKIFTDHMFIMDYEEGAGWHDARIVPYGNLEMSPGAMVFHYGQAVFEGMKCYRTKDNELQLFRPEQNFARLNKSDDRICMPHIDEDFALKALIELLKIDKEWVPQKDGTALYIRPFVIATEECINVRPSRQYKFIIILSPVASYYDAAGLEPVKIYIEDEYVRAVRGGIGEVKAAANYAIGLKSQEKAKEMGYTQVLWLDGIERKYIEEVGAMNVFFKIDGEIITPALQGSILPGITRDSVITMLKDLGYQVTERRISLSELFEAYEKGTFEEMFGTGTAAVVSPVGELIWKDEKIIINNGRIGEVSQNIYDTLTGIQYGNVKDKFNWIVKVD